jgi:hypothetical protein
MNAGNLGLRLRVDPPGLVEVPARQDAHIVIHFGQPVAIACERAGQRHSGLSIHGDIDIVPVGVAARWILKKRDCAFVVRLSQDLLTEVAAGLEIDPAALR